MAQDTKYDFPAISDGEVKHIGPSLGDAKFGDVVLQESPLFEYIGEDWKKGVWGEQIGTVTLKHFPTTVQGRIFVRAQFIFDDGQNAETVEYAGLVPGNGSWQGRGRLGYRGGTGRFSDRGGELDVESTNPKRWG
jgi:hypothetical protein